MRSACRGAHGSAYSPIASRAHEALDRWGRQRRVVELEERLRRRSRRRASPASKLLLPAAPSIRRSACSGDWRLSAELGGDSRRGRPGPRRSGGGVRRSRSQGGRRRVRGRTLALSPLPGRGRHRRGRAPRAGRRPALWAERARRRGGCAVRAAFCSWEARAATAHAPRRRACRWRRGSTRRWRSTRSSLESVMSDARSSARRGTRSTRRDGGAEGLVLALSPARRAQSHVSWHTASIRWPSGSRTNAA